VQEILSGKRIVGQVATFHSLYAAAKRLSGGESFGHRPGAMEIMRENLRVQQGALYERGETNGSAHTSWILQRPPEALSKPPSASPCWLFFFSEKRSSAPRIS